MLRSKLTIAAIPLLPVALILIGCSKSATTSQAPEKTAHINQDNADASHDRADSAEQSNQNREITAALDKLTVEDRALAIKQKTCPVSGELLGLMGAPVKMDVKGQAVFICCEGCKEKLLAKPDEYLAKINK